MRAQQHHESIFKPRPARSRAVIAEGRLRRLRSSARDQPHATAFGNRVDHLGIIEQSRLQTAGRLPRRRIGQKNMAGGQLADLLRAALRQHLALVQNDDVSAPLGFVQIGGAEQDGQPLVVDQLAG